MIPPSYIKARRYCVLPQQADGDVAFGVETESGIVRLRLSEADALWLVSGLLAEMSQRRTSSQSEISSGSRNLDGSPQDGQNV